MRQGAKEIRRRGPARQRARPSPTSWRAALDKVAERLGAATGGRDGETARLSDQLAKTQELRDRLSELQKTMDALSKAGDTRSRARQGSRAARTAGGQGKQPGAEGRDGQVRPAGHVRRRPRRRGAAPAARGRRQDARGAAAGRGSAEAESRDAEGRHDARAVAAQHLGAGHRKLQAGFREVGIAQEEPAGRARADRIAAVGSTARAREQGAPERRPARRRVGHAIASWSIAITSPSPRREGSRGRLRSDDTTTCSLPSLLPWWGYVLAFARRARACLAGLHARADAARRGHARAAGRPSRADPAAVDRHPVAARAGGAAVGREQQPPADPGRRLAQHAA